MPKERHEQEGVVRLADQAHVGWYNDGSIINVRQIDDVDAQEKDGASSSTRLQPQLTSSSLGLTPPLGATGDISDMFAGVMNGLDELRRDMTKRIDQVDGELTRVGRL